MIIALLAVLGVDLIVIAVLLAGVLGRRRWVRRQPEAFKGAIRVTSGRIHWLPARWHRGYGRWVRDILVWTPAPFLLRNILIPVDRVTGPVRPAEPGEVKRIGADPAIAAFTSDHSTIEIATAAKNRQLLPGPGARRASDWFQKMAEPPGARGHSAGPQQRSRLSRLVAGQQRSDPLPAGSETASRVLHGKPSAAAVPCRRYWLRNLKTVHGLGAERGGVFAGGMHFRNQAGQVRSVLSLISYLWSGQYRERYLGVKIPSARIQDYLEAARKIATGRPAAWRSPARALPQTMGSSGGLASGWAE